MAIPEYVLYEKRLNERWSLMIFVDRQGNVITRMTETVGFIFPDFKTSIKLQKASTRFLNTVNKMLRDK